MPSDPKKPHRERPDIRPLNRTSSRVFIVLGLLAALAVSFLAAYIVVQSSQDPEIQRQVEEARARERGELPPDTSAVPPADSSAHR